MRFYKNELPQINELVLVTFNNKTSNFFEGDLLDLRNLYFFSFVFKKRFYSKCFKFCRKYISMVPPRFKISTLPRVTVSK
mgnify:CR=1 FL=1